MTNGIAVEVALRVRPLVPDDQVSLDILFVRFDAIARRGQEGSGAAAREAILDRLSANREAAETNGWTSCSLERRAGMGRLQLWGIPPKRELRELVPDWSARER